MMKIIKLIIFETKIESFLRCLRPLEVVTINFYLFRTSRLAIEALFSHEWTLLVFVAPAPLSPFFSLDFLNKCKKI